MGRRYKNPPVVEALCEIFFDGSQWDSTLTGLFLRNKLFDKMGIMLYNCHIDKIKVGRSHYD